MVQELVVLAVAAVTMAAAAVHGKVALVDLAIQLAQEPHIPRE